MLAKGSRRNTEACKMMEGNRRGQGRLLRGSNVFVDPKS